MDNRNHAASAAGKPKPLLVYIVALYAASLLIANVMAGHLLVFVRWTASAGILAFPITYILASVLGEVYGYRWARRAAWLSLTLNALMAGLIQLGIMLPSPDWYVEYSYHEAFASTIGNTWRVVLASLTAFAIGKFANDRIFVNLKGKRANMEGFKFRVMASSIVGHFLDSGIFTLIAFAAIFPWNALPEMILVSVALKLAYEGLALPLTVFIVNKVKTYEAAT